MIGKSVGARTTRKRDEEGGTEEGGTKERWYDGKSKLFGKKMKAATPQANNAYRYTTALTQNGLEQSYEIISQGSTIGKTGIIILLR